MASADPGTYEPTLDILEAFLKRIGGNVVYATAQALNTVALEFQNYQRTYQELTFTIRERQFFRFAIKTRPNRRRKVNGRSVGNALGDRATKSDLSATVFIDDRVRRQKGFGAARRPDIWQRLQFDETRKPKGGSKALAVPTSQVERTAKGLIKKKDYPTKPGGGIPKRQFIVPFPSGDAGVFRRIGRRQKAFVQGADKGLKPGEDPNVRFLYVLKSKTPLKPEFDYYENARFVFKRRWPQAIETQMIRAFRTIRFRKGGFR